jgi:O-acetyl-ADP-ribose deacetylase (regulator of RNase III)
MALVRQHHFSSIAFPIVGAGSGGMSVDRVLTFMLEEFRDVAYEGRVVVVRFSRAAESLGGPTKE